MQGAISSSVQNVVLTEQEVLKEGHAGSRAIMVQRKQEMLYAVAEAEAEADGGVVQ